jgi:response regulator NasT
VRILLAEDETIIRLDLRTLLERRGYTVCGEARDGEEAILLARELAPDLAIVDIRMPRLDGIEAARRIQAERPTPIVLLTAFSDKRLVARAIDVGVFAYVVKPFAEEDLLPAVETAAARHQELLNARRELGKTQTQAPLDLVVTSSSGLRWPLRISRHGETGVDVSVLADDRPC